MNMVTDLFFPLDTTDTPPAVFPSPFDVLAHPLAEQAAQSLKQRIPQLCHPHHDVEQPDGGKMFGVLVVSDGEGRLGYLSAFSGMLGDRWERDGFVPPVFDSDERRHILAAGEAEVEQLSHAIMQMQTDAGFVAAEKRLQQLDMDVKDQLRALKKLHTDKKLQRHEKRLDGNVTEAQLKLFAQESRQDKYEYKKLVHELASVGADDRQVVSDQKNKIEALTKRRKKQSHKLQMALFDGYRLYSADAKNSGMRELFESASPPSGAGDCAAIKLVQYANLNQLKPVALVEFWWGAPPAGGLRKHGRVYPACRSKCRPLLPFMLSGVPLAVPLHEQPPSYTDDIPHVLYEDNDIVLIDKPVGLLSVPGKVLTDSVESRLQARYPEVQGVMLLHRLDQATSGVMIAAKNRRAHKGLQLQFQDRTIEKCYVALLDGELRQCQGDVRLPMRVDITDRPRQIVCADRGKSALTRYTILSKEGANTRVAFYPHTGRTHQLRVHAAHPDGLDCPILGDELYGRPLDRLYLHAEKISFMHPIEQRVMSVSSDVPF